MRRLILLVLIFYGCSKYNDTFTDIKLVTNRDYFPTVRDLIRLSNEYVYFAIYVARLDGYNQVSMLVNELIQAKGRGIEIKILLDSSSFDNNLNVSNFAFAETLKKYGISVRFDDPDTATHCKFGIFDGKKVLIGSTNWTYSSLERNNEVNILITDSELSLELKKYFEKLWGIND